jgi:hypothetical protein
MGINLERVIMRSQTEPYLSRIRSKMHNKSNSSVLNFSFPLHDAILFQEHGKTQGRDFQAGA